MSTSSIQPGLLRKMTVRRILEVLIAQGPASRADLVRQTGISAPTVSKAVSTLLATGLIEEGELPEGGMGRPARLVHLAKDAAQVVGVVLDQRGCEVVTAGLDGRVRNKHSERIRTPQTYAKLIDSIGTAIEAVRDRSDAVLLGIGLSIPGLVNTRTQEAILSPNLRITNGQSPAHDLAYRFDCETVGLQETHALCLAERLKRRGELLDNFAMLDATTGLGLGMVTDGNLLLGHSGLAGELGHITMQPQGRTCGCGNQGCLETLATDSAFAHLVSERLGTPLGFEEIRRLVGTGEIDVETEIRQTTLYLAIAIAAAINLLNPRTLFVHAGLLDLQEGLFEHVVELTRRRALNASFEQCDIRRADGDKQQGAVSGIIHHLTTELSVLGLARDGDHGVPHSA